MHGERGMLWIAGEVTIVSDAPSLARIVPSLWNYGIAVRCVRYDDALEPSGLLVVDARAGIKRALAFLRESPRELRRDAIIIANPLEPFVYRTIGSVCQGVVLYDPVSTSELAQVIDNVLSRRKAS